MLVQLHSFWSIFCGENTTKIRASRVRNTLLSIVMSKRELAQILEQQEWHDRARWNEDGTPSSARVGAAAAALGGEGRERKRRRVFAEEEEEEEKPASPGTFLKEEEYFDAGEEENDDDEEEDESVKLLREIATSLRALETKVDALIVARSTEKNSKKKKKKC